MAEWRLVESGPARGSWNLALDDAIFRAVAGGESPPTLRLYSWSAAALTIGYGQDRERDVDLEACRARGVEVLRRVTGGRAVLHDAEVTYSVASPSRGPLFGGGLDAACRRVAEGLLAALRALGVRGAAVVPGRRGARQGREPGCFAACSRHEVSVGERKLIGSAQRREGGAFLQHGSILLEGHGDPLEGLLRRPTARSGAPGMVGLAELLEPCPSREAVAAALASGFAAAWGVRFERGAPTEAEFDHAREIEVARYRSEAWNGAPRGARSR